MWATGACTICFLPLIYYYTVKALASNHLRNSKKWSQLERVAYAKNPHKRPHGKTVEGGRLGEPQKHIKNSLKKTIAVSVKWSSVFISDIDMAKLYV